MGRGARFAVGQQLPATNLLEERKSRGKAVPVLLAGRPSSLRSVGG